MVFKNICVLVLWMKVAPTLKGLTYQCLGVPTEIVAWNSGNFDNNFVIENDVTKCLKGSGQ